MTSSENAAMQYLSQYKTLDEKINKLCEVVFFLRSSSISTSGGNMDGMPHSANCKTAAAFESAVDRLEPLEMQLDGMQDKFADLKASLNKTINNITSSRLRKLLRLKYMSNKYFTWNDISVYINSSPHMARKKLHQQAIKIFTQYIVLPIDR